ncbi:MAG: diguanylate cyclase domain-containing protein [Gammaproteobacteria bacterium]
MIKKSNHIQNANVLTTEPAIQQQVDAELISSVYKETHTGLIASLFCATILLIGLYSVSNPAMIIGWYVFFWLVILARFILVKMYFNQIEPKNTLEFWRKSFMLGAWAAGALWGFISSVLFPYPHQMQMMLDILILAGMTAGAVPILSGILNAGRGFLILAVLPVNIRLLLIGDTTLLLYDLALVAYLFFLLVITKKTYKILNNAVSLQFENNILLQNFSDAKKQLQISNKKLAYAATHDPLTNLINLSLFEKELSETLEYAKSERQSFAILYIDIDNLKEVNDTYSRQIGDRLLKNIVDRIVTILPKEAIAARFGGDEIVVILENITDPDEVAKVAQQICAAMKASFEIEECNIITTISIGIVIYPVDGRDTEILLRNADKAMLIAKEEGDNTFCFNTDPATLRNAIMNAFPNTSVK